MENSKPLVFLSYTDDGAAEAIEIKRRLESELNVKVWEWKNEILVGAPVVSSYSEAVAKSDFMVAVVSPMYWSKQGTKREYDIANAREVELKDTYGDNYHFVLPYIGEWKLPKRADKNYKMAAYTIENLVRSISSQLSPAIMSRSIHSFSEWPNPFVKNGGEIDCLIAIGHNDKQDDLVEEDLGVLGKYINLEERAGHQSHRPAELIPNIANYLHNKSSLYRSETKSIDDCNINSFFECHIDVLLIKHRFDLIRNHNIITLGAGDTNYISRWVLEYYKDTLPIYFRNTSASEDISIRSYSDNKDDLKRDSFSGKDRYSALLAIVPNPFNHEKSIVVAAGLNALSTQASILALSDANELIKNRQPQDSNIAYLVAGVEDRWRAVDYDLKINPNKSN